MKLSMNVQTGDVQAEAAALREEVEELRQRQVELDRALVRRAYRIDELEREMRAIEQSFRSSLSWRITAPLRILKPMLRNLLRR